MNRPRAEEEDDAVELLTWSPEDGTDEDEEEPEDELPADEHFAGEEWDGEDTELPVEPAVEVVEEVVADGYSKNRPAALPQPDRARSHPDLPKVKSSAFKRVIR